MTAMVETTGTHSMTGHETLIFMAICAVGLLICLGIGYRMSRQEKKQ